MVRAIAIAWENECVLLLTIYSSCPSLELCSFSLSKNIFGHLERAMWWDCPFLPNDFRVDWVLTFLTDKEKKTECVNENIQACEPAEILYFKTLVKALQSFFKIKVDLLEMTGWNMPTCKNWIYANDSHRLPPPHVDRNLSCSLV